MKQNQTETVPIAAAGFQRGILETSTEEATGTNVNYQT